MQKLEYLNLCGNRIKTIHFPVDLDTTRAGCTTALFLNLTRLNISENLISDWRSISELNKLASLKALRIDTNPVFDSDSRETNRQMIIARLDRVTQLGGVQIFRQERRDAELDYVKKFSAQWVKSENDIVFMQDHPRFPSLIQTYGRSEIGETEGKDKSLKSCLISLKLKPENPSIRPSTKSIVKTMTVQKLKMLVQRTFKIPRASSLEITVQSSKNLNIKFKLENDFFDLAQYSIEDGDILELKW